MLIHCLPLFNTFNMNNALMIAKINGHNFDQCHLRFFCSWWAISFPHHVHFVIGCHWFPLQRYPNGTKDQMKYQITWNSCAIIRIFDRLLDLTSCGAFFIFSHVEDRFWHLPVPSLLSMSKVSLLLSDLVWTLHTAKRKSVDYFHLPVAFHGLHTMC